jgi:hypothetical protein
VSYRLFLAFTCAPFSTRNWQTTNWPFSEDKCSGDIPLKIPDSEHRKQNKSRKRNCLGLVVVLDVCRIHVRSHSYEKLANVQVASFGRPMQRCFFTKSTRIKTLQTPKLLKVHAYMRMRRGNCRTWSFLHSRPLRFLRETGKYPSDLVQNTNAAELFH